MLAQHVQKSIRCSVLCLLRSVGRALLSSRGRLPAGMPTGHVHDKHQRHLAGGVPAVPSGLLLRGGPRGRLPVWHVQCTNRCLARVQVRCLSNPCIDGGCRLDECERLLLRQQQRARATQHHKRRRTHMRLPSRLFAQRNWRMRSMWARLLQGGHRRCSVHHVCCWIIHTISR